jgi:hypothetical protein
MKVKTALLGQKASFKVFCYLRSLAKINFKDLDSGNRH